MARRSDSHAPPRAASPDLPDALEPASGLRARCDLLGVLVTDLAGDVTAAHGRLAESRIAPASPDRVERLDRLDLTGATLADVIVDDLRAAELVARDGSWRNVVVEGGRIGTLDGLRATWDAVAFRSVRIDYLSLPSAELADVLFAQCTFGTVDVPEASLERVAFTDCRADEVDTRGLRARDLDLRGLEAAAITDPRGLSGATLAPHQAEFHAAAFARALGIRVAP